MHITKITRWFYLYHRMRNNWMVIFRMTTLQKFNFDVQKLWWQHWKHPISCNRTIKTFHGNNWYLALHLNTVAIYDLTSSHNILCSQENRKMSLDTSICIASITNLTLTVNKIPILVHLSIVMLFTFPANWANNFK